MTLLSIVPPLFWDSLSSVQQTTPCWSPV